MYAREIDTRRSARTVANRIREAMRGLTGDPSRYGDSLMREFYAYYVHTLFTKVHEAYMIKSSGAADELGQRWAPLSEATKRSRPVTEAERQQFRLSGSTTRGLLSPAEDKLWRRIFRSKVQALVRLGFHEETEAKPRAAAAAWYILKARGAKTKKGIAANRTIPILIDTGRLERSYRPGTPTKSGYVPYNGDQFYEARRNRFAWGSSVPYGRYHQEGTRNMPARPPIPPARTMRRWTIQGVTRGMQQVVNRIIWNL